MRLSKANRPEKVWKDFKNSQKIEKSKSEILDQSKIDSLKSENIQSIFFEKELKNNNKLQFKIITNDNVEFRIELKENSMAIDSLKRYVKHNFKVL